ncbi:hypothetical protein BFW01_g12859 [Lasiodiplodia theobromae]|nr:hypothetical protein BFW01_g12859 [Lasiodiplodia theobromae]
MHFSSVISLCLLALGHGAAAQYSLSQGNRNCAPGGAIACQNKGQYCVVATDTGYVIATHRSTIIANNRE